METINLSVILTSIADAYTISHTRSIVKNYVLEQKIDVVVIRFQALCVMDSIVCILFHN